MDQFGKDPLQDRHVMVGERIREVALEPFHMVGPRPVEDPSAPIAHGDVELPPILATQASIRIPIVGRDSGRLLPQRATQVTAGEGMSDCRPDATS